METLTISKRKRQIVEQATLLFKSKGYSASSMRDLASLMGMEAASLYSHIKSKEELLQQICFKMAAAFFSAVEHVDQPTPDLQLASAIKAHFRVITEHIDASAVFFNEWRHLSESFLSDFLSMRGRYEKIFLNIIESGIEQEIFKPMDQKLAMMTILSSINWTHQWYNQQGQMSVEEIGNQLSELLIGGITKTRN